MLRFSRTTRSLAFLFMFVLVGTNARSASDFLSLGIAWSSRLDSPPLTPPVVGISTDLVYLALRSGTVRALALRDGAIVWSIDLPVVTALSAADGMVAGATKREVVVIDGATGRVRWSVPLSDVSAAPALRAGWVVAGSGPELLAFRAADGSLVWRLALGAALASPVTIEGDRVYAPLADGTLAAVAITGGTILWRVKLPAVGGTVTAVGDRLYLGAADKFFYALKAGDGDRGWRWRAGAAVLSPVAVDESRVYYTALDNVVRAVDAGSGVLKWRYAMESRPLAGPLVDDDLVIVATTTDLRAVRAADGSLAGKVTAPAELAAPPAIVSRTTESFATRAVIVTGAATGDWRVYGLARSPEPAPQPLKEIPGRPLSPDVPPVPPGLP